MTRLLLLTLVQHTPCSTGREEERTPSVQGEAGRPQREGGPERLQGPWALRARNSCCTSQRSTEQLHLGGLGPKSTLPDHTTEERRAQASPLPHCPQALALPKCQFFFPLHSEELNLPQTEVWLLPQPLGDHALQATLDGLTTWGVGGTISWPGG